MEGYSSLKLSNNFSLSEFVNNGRELTPVQIFMLKYLCVKILEPIRSFLNCKIKINNGVRFPSDINRLRNQGYNPSETSDHLYGTAVRVKSLRKKAIYGSYFSYSVGAADIVPECGALYAFDLLKKHIDFDNKCLKLPVRNGFLIVRIGQFILEKNRSYWLHISNPYNLIYSEKFCVQFLKKKPFLVSLDNGKTYTSIKF